jgi:hypothetical protein
MHQLALPIHVYFTFLTHVPLNIYCFSSDFFPLPIFYTCVGPADQLLFLYFTYNKLNCFLTELRCSPGLPIGVGPSYGEESVIGDRGRAERHVPRRLGAGAALAGGGGDLGRSRPSWRRRGGHRGQQKEQKLQDSSFF